MHISQVAKYAFPSRVDMLMQKRFRVNGKVMTQYELLAELDLVEKRVHDGTMKYNRRRFNQMNGKEQREYMARLEAQRFYLIWDSENIGHYVPKLIYDAIDLPVSSKSL